MKSVKRPCETCNGLGTVDRDYHYEGGICYSCDGTGVWEWTLQILENERRVINIQRETLNNREKELEEIEIELNKT